jgi:hypothetical protein
MELCRGGPGLGWELCAQQLLQAASQRRDTGSRAARISYAAVTTTVCLFMRL